jgi:hypothetical protein
MGNLHRFDILKGQSSKWKTVFAKLHIPPESGWLYIQAVICWVVLLFGRSYPEILQIRTNIFQIRPDQTRPDQTRPDQTGPKRPKIQQVQKVHFLKYKSYTRYKMCKRQKRSTKVQYRTLQKSPKISRTVPNSTRTSKNVLNAQH